jgi:hypothetical protein
MKKVEKVMQEVEKVTILCDLCGSGEGMPRYAQNRTCHRCGREACGNCQGPYPDLEIEGRPVSSHEETICVICRDMEPEYLPEINETYRRRDELLKQWKENSLARIAANVRPF